MAATVEAQAAVAAQPTAEAEEAPVGFKMPPLATCIEVIGDLRRPIAQRMRAIFYLRTYGGDAAVTALETALRDKAGSTLFRHEIAYVLGQMQALSAAPTLMAVLEDETDDVIVRHEAGEALGAIGAETALPLLDTLRLSTSAPLEVRETCEIAADRVRWFMRSRDGSAAAETAHTHAHAHAHVMKEPEGRENPYESVDPAPALSAPKRKEDVAALQAVLMDTSLPLFQRYRAMFALRNAGNKAAVLALCTGLSDTSALFRHEIAYVLGQMAHAASIPALKKAVLDPAEHDMVRHEAAEALGAVGTGECEEFLSAYVRDDAAMLRESCVVALDIADYWAADAEGVEGKREAT